MLQTSFTTLVGLDHPLASAGMGGGTTSGELVGAVSEAGALGVVGATFLSAEETADIVRRARELTTKPIGINLLLHAGEERVDEILAHDPDVFSTAWPRDDQDLSAIFSRAHDRGCRVMHMVPVAADAVRAVEAGADIVVAQGFEGGGHVGELASTVIVRQVVKAVTPVPVLAAGGFVDGAGLAAALALGADGVLLGTRFLATEEAPIDDAYKEAIVRSDGSDTVVTTLSDSLSGRDWPGAWARLKRTPFVEHWLGREPELRRRRERLWEQVAAFQESNDDDGLMWMGQSAGLIDSIKPAAEVVRDIVADAEEILRALPH